MRTCGVQCRIGFVQKSSLKISQCRRLCVQKSGLKSGLCEISFVFKKVVSKVSSKVLCGRCSKSGLKSGHEVRLLRPLFRTQSLPHRPPFWTQGLPHRHRFWNHFWGRFFGHKAYTPMTAFFTPHFWTQVLPNTDRFFRPHFWTQSLQPHDRFLGRIFGHKADSLMTAF